MPSKRQRKFCTIFVRSEQEKKAAALVRDLDATKKELEDTKEIMSTLLKEVESLKKSVNPTAAKRGRPKKEESE